MVFNTFTYLIFFPTILLLYYLSPFKWRWIILLVASYFFYMCWKVEYVTFLMISTVVDFFMSHKIAQANSKLKKKLFLSVTLMGNFSLLFTFKYFNFFSHTANILLEFFHSPYTAPKLDLILPVGISFYTFQTIAYAIDVYHGRVQPEPHLGKFAVFVSFFPQLVAGPIERARDLLPQFNREVRPQYENFASGLVLIVWGLIKKAVLADRLGFIVNLVYQHPQSWSSFYLVLATVAFALQIYCDFSGYTDVARGSAKMLGIHLCKNFARPYSSQSVAEFWRRWHISLSTWFRDYVYIPLGGHKLGQGRWAINILITFAVSGLWHGANYTFLIWGLLNGLFIVIARFIPPLLPQPRRVGTKFLATWFNRLVTFCLVCLTWIFFRAANLSDALYIVRHLTSDLSSFRELFGSPIFFHLQDKLGIHRADLRFCLYTLVVLGMLHTLEERGDLYLEMKKWFPPMRYAVYCLGVLVLLNKIFIERIPFIYFQF